MCFCWKSKEIIENPYFAIVQLPLQKLCLKEAKTKMNNFGYTIVGGYVVLYFQTRPSIFGRLYEYKSPKKFVSS